MLTKSKYRRLSLVLLPLILVINTGADHRDAPGLISDPASDINDVYAFVNANTGNVVLAMSVNPFTAPGINPTFSPDTLYQFKIDNTGNTKDGPVENLVIQFTFDPPDNIGTPIDPSKPSITTNTTTNPAQKFTMHGPGKPSKTGIINSVLTSGPTISGMIDNSTNGNVTTDASTGIKVFAGARDDPFFFDLPYVLGYLRDPATSQFVPKRAPGIDFFAGVNVSVIAVEIPPAMLKGSSNTIKVWGTTNVFTTSKRGVTAKKGENPAATVTGSKTYAQFDRMGLPAVNTALIFPEHKNAFNLATPSQDATLFHTDVVNHLLLLNGNDMANATGTAGVVLPDVLTLDVTSTKGFGSVTNGVLTATLNGRRPEDDVISVELFVFSKGVLQGLNPTQNDVPFLANFPFFAPPHQAGEGVPKRN